MKCNFWPRSEHEKTVGIWSVVQIVSNIVRMRCMCSTWNSNTLHQSGYFCNERTKCPYWYAAIFSYYDSYIQYTCCPTPINRGRDIWNLCEHYPMISQIDNTFCFCYINKKILSVQNAAVSYECCIGHRAAKVASDLSCPIHTRSHHPLLYPGKHP